MLGTEHKALCVLVTWSTTKLHPSSLYEFNTFSYLFPQLLEILRKPKGSSWFSQNQFLS